MARSRVARKENETLLFRDKGNLALLLFAAGFIVLGGDSTLVRNATAQPDSTTSANEVAGQGNAGQVSLPAAAREEEEHGLPQKAVEIARPFGFPITNSMVVSWIVALFLIIFARMATRNMKQVPQGAQNFMEWLVEGLFGILEGIMGRHLTERTFWFFATIFILILFMNWAGLIPGVGTVGWGVQTDDRFLVTRPLLRGGNADMNLTFAMAMIFFACWLVWAIQANGVKGFVLHLFGPRGDTSGLLKFLMIFVFIAVGFLEVVSILFRPVSLSFRLYGNIFAGENMVETMINMSPILAWIAPIPFYFLEVLVGLVQALVFMLLTTVFTMLICMHDEEPGSAHH